VRHHAASHTRRGRPTLSAALTIRTTYTAPGAEAPYDDDVATDGTLRYKWRGTDADHADNRALR